MKISLIGYGKMGKMIEQIAIQRGHIISYIIDIENLQDVNNLSPLNTDIVIEFTQPHSAFENVSKCFEKGINVVCGTTGWNDTLKEAQNLALKYNTGFIWSSNFSVGVNLFFKLNQYLAQLMHEFNQYEPSVKEIHHIHKKDAPSGTAITITEDILKNITTKKNWELNTQSHPENLKIIAERSGEVPGTHIVSYESAEDIIEITHIAKNRRGFALGAVIAAEFLKDKKGIYSMENVLNF